MFMDKIPFSMKQGNIHDGKRNVLFCVFAKNNMIVFPDDKTLLMLILQLLKLS